MTKLVSMDEAIGQVKDGMTIMVGGFMGCGSPHTFLTALAASGRKDLILICNDGGCLMGPNGKENYGVAKLIVNRQVKKIIASHVGANPEIARQMNEGSLEVVLVPQGSLVEMIRAGGAGLGGVLTPTGVGTPVEEADHVHSTVEIDGIRYLLERPLKADVAVISGYRVDPGGNVWYKGTTRNFNEVMALAGGTVIAEADHLVEAGAITPEDVVTPGVLVDYIVKGGPA